MDLAKKYQKLTQVKHILTRPHMYIGSIEEIEDKVWILEDNKIIEKEIKMNPGFYKIFDEIVVNAYDQTVRDKTVGIIKAEIDQAKKEISVYNDGVGIDIAIHPKEKVYIPELIFGHLLTSTSFDESKVRITGGIHGLGAKLTAIFSTYFKVDVGDAKRKKRFQQVYRKNLSKKSEPKITNYDGTGYVKITYKPDLEYFKMNDISDDVIGLMNRRIYDIAALTKKSVKVYLNKTRVPVTDFSKYVSLFTDKEYIMERCDPSSVKYNEERWRIIITPSDGRFKQMSFVNGIYTMHGGRHVDYIMNKIVSEIKRIILKKYKKDIGTRFIRDQMWIFLASVIENPTFPSQTKDELNTPVSKFGSTCELSKGFIKKVYTKLNIDNIVQQHIKMTETAELSKLDAKRKKTVKGIKKLYDANYAGTKKLLECTLILTEGDSAKTMAISGLSAIPKANNYYGVYPLKGKMLNVREAKHKQIMANEEFKNIIKIMGLSQNKVYTKETISDLRYGSIMLMMDADVDGSHIKGLFINMIDYYWSSLLKLDGFIKIFITPMVKVTNTRDNKVISFYSQSEYEKWAKRIHKMGDINKWKIKYYKGLGTNTAREAKDYFKNLDKHVVGVSYEISSNDAIKLAFAKDKADDRKQWLKNYDQDIVIDYSKQSITYKEFINKELIHFSNYDNIRSIPSMVDGLKPSQRKVLYAAFKKKLNSDIKVAQFVGYISEHTAYHHGEISLAKTIIGMAQDHVGSNNKNILMPKGQFGTRLMGGKDNSSPRYIFTQLDDAARLIYHRDDDGLLTYLDDDGFMIEPEYYIPIIPMLLVNGCEGIGTGWSTFVPNFNPLDVIENLERKLEGGRFRDMHPWYNKFKGSIIKTSKNKYIIKGIYIKKNNVINIIELPVKTWTDGYKNKIETLIADGKINATMINNSNEEDVNIIIRFKDKTIVENLEKQIDQGINGIEKILGLVNKLNMENMYLHDSKGQIKHYNSVIAILDEFYKLRLDKYRIRKELILKKIEEELKIIDSKVKFIDLVIKKKIVLFNKTKNNIIKLLEQNKLYKINGEYDYLIRMTFYTLTKEKINELKRLQDDKKKEYNRIKRKKIEDIWLDDLAILKKTLKKLQ